MAFTLRFPAVPYLRIQSIRLHDNDAAALGWSSSIGKASSGLSHSPLQVVLVSPQIPGNTGAIARTCAATLVGLHLVKPLGFSIEDTKLKRAGLDYWPYVVAEVHDSWPDFLEYFHKRDGANRLIAFTKKGKSSYLDLCYRPGDWLVFGSETEGLSPEILDDCSRGTCMGGTARIPINQKHVRSLNLSVAAGVGVFEALRQLHANHDITSIEEQNSSSTEDIFS